MSIISTDGKANAKFTITGHNTEPAPIPDPEVRHIVPNTGDTFQ